MSAGNSQGVVIEPIDIKNYRVVESSDMSWANDDGSVSVAANSEAVLAEYEPTGDEVQILLHALGAANANGVRFRLKYGQEISNTMESPPGSINEPYSFTKNFGAPLTSDDIVQYVAMNSTGSEIKLAARMHLEVAPGDATFPRGQIGVR